MTVKRINLILALLGLALFLAMAIHFINHAPDDIWISLRYAQHLAQGQGLTFNAAERVEGFSNFLWVMLLSIFVPFFSKAGMTLLAKLIGIAGGLMAGLALARTAYKYPLAKGAENLWGLTVFAYGLNLFAAFWAASGMETGFYLLLIAGAVWMYSAFSARRSLPTAIASSLLFLGLALMRPEGIIFFLAAAISEIFIAWRERHKPERMVYLWLAMTLLFYGLFYLWRFSYFGQWLPNSFYAKALGGSKQYGMGLRYLLLNLPALFWSNPVLMLLLILPFINWRGANQSVIFLGGCLLGQLAFTWLAGGDWMEAGRFVVPVMPAVALLLPAAVCEARHRLGFQAPSLSRAARYLLAVLIVGCIILHLYQSKQVRQDVSGWRSYEGAYFFKPDHFAVAQYLKQNARSDDLIALGESGLIPYLTELPILDMFGLMDKYLARLPGVRNDKFDPDYVFQRQPKYIVLGGCRFWGAEVDCDFLYSRTLLADPRLKQNYDYVYNHHTFLVYRLKGAE